MMRKESGRLAIAALGPAIAWLLVAAPCAAGILTTKHNLSASGPGPIKASGETQVCVFCHIPHNAHPAVPLWGHASSPATYTIYTSATLQGSAGQPNGSSKLCLACHDGAVAVGAVVPSYAYPAGSSIAMTGAGPGGEIPAGPTSLGTNLSDDHPVSLLPATGAAADPEIVTGLPGDSAVQYDRSGQVQCTSCHNPHDNPNGNFLVLPQVAGGFGSQLCLACHAKFNWGRSSHRVSDKVHAGRPVKAQACAACHQVHTAAVPESLLLSGEEGLCNSCHDGSASVVPAIKNVAGEFAFPYKHPTDMVSGKHEAAETFLDLTDPAKRHAECVDCHNPHNAQTGTHNPSGTHVPGSSKIGAVLIGAWGMKPIYGTTPWSDPVSWEKVVFTNNTDPDMLEAYLCFKCHKELARDFNPNNPSYHAVVGDSKADPAYAGSYVNGWSPSSRMSCTDCHTSSNPAVKGPHGSSFAENAHALPGSDTIVTDPIIAFADYLRGGGHGPSLGRHWTNRGTGGTLDAYGNPRSSDNDLCFHCHNRRVYGHPTDNSYLYGITTTGYRGPYDPGENLHLGHVRGKACTTCHVVHGSNKPHLLSFAGDSFALNSRLNVYSPFPDGGGWSYQKCHGGSYTGC